MPSTCIPRAQAKPTLVQGAPEYRAIRTQSNGAKQSSEARRSEFAHRFGRQGQSLVIQARDGKWEGHCDREQRCEHARATRSIW